MNGEVLKRLERIERKLDKVDIYYLNLLGFSYISFLHILGFVWGVLRGFWNESGRKKIDHTYSNIKEELEGLYNKSESYVGKEE